MTLRPIDTYFLSLNWKDSSSIRMDKKRSKNLCKVSAVGAQSEQLPFPFKVPSPQQLMKRKASQEDERRKFASNSLASTVILPFPSSTFAFDSNRKAPLFQKENALSTLPLLDKMVESASYSSFNNIAISNQNMAVIAPMKTPPFEGLLPAKPHLVHATIDSANGFNDKTTYLRENAKTTLRLSSSLTIFYGDEVHVYNGVSPEKAQTVNQMAGNGSFEAVKEVHEIQKQQLPAVPMAQARRATLARFLERRKHRLWTWELIRWVGNHVVTKLDGSVIFITANDIPPTSDKCSSSAIISQYNKYDSRIP